MNTFVDIQHAYITSKDKTIPTDQELTLWVTQSIQQAVRQNKNLIQDSYEVCLRIVDLEEIHQLNKQYRHKDSPTNVLSFPFESPSHIESPLLGDIVICAAIVNLEAVQQHKSITAHWTHMTIHGTLHLLGFDHINSQDARIMEKLEIDILQQHTIDNPYYLDSKD